MTDEYKELDIHSILCEGMELIANSLQNFGSWGRRVSVLVQGHLEGPEVLPACDHQEDDRSSVRTSVFFRA